MIESALSLHDLARGNASPLRTLISSLSLIAGNNFTCPGCGSPITLNSGYTSHDCNTINCAKNTGEAIMSVAVVVIVGKKESVEARATVYEPSGRRIFKVYV